jgi:Amt family ammonium transporter
VYDDTLDAFGLHGVGGIVGGIMTGLLHQKSIAMLDGVETEGGAIDGNWTKVRTTDCCMSIHCRLVILSYAILFIINKIPGLQLRVSPEEERDGQDVSEMGESAYEFDMGFGKSLAEAIYDAESATKEASINNEVIRA